MDYIYFSKLILLKQNFKKFSERGDAVGFCKPFQPTCQKSRGQCYIKFIKDVTQ
jgi:hypothetical protein